MYALTLDGGTCLSTPPDVCQTPATPSPVPVPYVNQFDAADVTPSTASRKVFLAGAGALTVKSKAPRSSGDEAGVNGGVVSGRNMGQGEFISGSMKVMIEGQKAVMQSSQTKHNNGNTIGMCLQARQTKVDFSM
ncbi:MAG: DUF4150 domain-containing protein [Desulfovibrionaceae bacterium]|nr:DUF4150 domain-containing protein [Desulfovibrionaceae bacterium]